MLFGLLGLFSGCIRESLDKCPFDARLRFTYFPKGEVNDLFGQRVEQVNLCVYRSDGAAVFTQTLYKAQLDSFPGIKLSLLQGEYTVVCWANASTENTRLKSFAVGDNIGNLYVDHPSAETSSDIPTLDPLLFVSRRITIIDEDQTDDTVLNFLPRTIHVSVDLKGISHQPTIRLNNLPTALQSYYDETASLWGVKPVDVADKSFLPVVTYDAAQPRATTEINVPRFKADTPGTIELFDQAGELIIPAISIAELLERYHIQIENDNEVNLLVEITFVGGNTQITLKNWEEQPVKPGGLG